MTVCRYFLQGNCRFGERCRFEHTNHSSNNYSSSYRGNNYNGSYRGNNYDSYRGNNYNDSYKGNNYNSSYRGNNYSGSYTGNNYGGTYTGNNYSGAYRGNYNVSYGPQRHTSNERYDQNQLYYSFENQHQSSSLRPIGQHNPYESPRYNSNSRYDDPNYERNYDRGKHQWISEDYSKQMQQKLHRSTNDSYVNTSTPKSQVAFSFKDSEYQPQKDPPSDLHMNDKNMIYAEMIKEDTTVWELGNQWLFTCYFPLQDKSGFPGFFDLSPEELRYEAYKAKETNTYPTYVALIERAVLDVKSRRNLLKEPSLPLMSIINKIRKGEDLISELTVNGRHYFSQLNESSVEDMAAEDPVLPSSNAFSFFNSKNNFDMGDSASSFSFKLPTESEIKQPVPEITSDIYTPLDELSLQDKEQFSASTFTLGKIPTVPPPQVMCL